MTKEDFLDKIIKLWGADAPGLVPNLSAIAELFGDEVPEYKFALRENLNGDEKFLPTRAEPKATGWDVRAAQVDKKPIIVRPLEQIKIPLGFRSFCPDGWWFEIKPRSSTFVKKNLHALYGTIDETYEGEAIFACQYIPAAEPYKNWDCYVTNNQLKIEFGDAIGQIIPIRRQEMKTGNWTNEEYDNACKERNSIRGAGGFGSTDGQGK